MKPTINVVAMLIAFVAAVALLKDVISLALRLWGQHDPRPLQTFLGWLNAPFSRLMGVP